MGIVLISTIAVVAISFLILYAYVRQQSVPGRSSGTGSLRVPDPLPVREPPCVFQESRAYFQTIMPAPQPISVSSPKPVPGPMPKPEPVQVGASLPAVSKKSAVAEAPVDRKITRIDRGKPAVFYTHKHLIPLVEKLAEDVWPTRKEPLDACLKSLPYKDYSMEQATALKPHHASLRLFTVLDASFSVRAFRKEHRQFHELLYYHVARNCGNRELARKIAMGVHKYTRNSKLIFGGHNEKVVLAQLNGVFWSDVFAERPEVFEKNDPKSFHFTFSMACDFTAHYDTVLAMMEKHCGVALDRPVFAIVLPPEPKTKRGQSTEKRERGLVFSPEDGLYESVSGTFHDLLDWIEDTEQFRRLYDDTLQQGNLDVCYFCGSAPDKAPTVTLSNGWKVHERCCDMLAGRLAELRSVQAARMLFKTSPNLLCAYRLINTYWPQRPPDWENRLEMIFARAEGVCENCGKPDAKLDVAYVRPLEKGGNHACDNLLCLCPACTEELKTHLESGTEAEWRSFYRQKLERIGEAMGNERKLLFSYKENETRVIVPREWVKRRGYWLVRGHCYLHSDERLFNPRKMSDLKVL